jgi:cell division septal protein FtsQ
MFPKPTLRKETLIHIAIYTLLFALGFSAIKYDWPAMKKVVVRGTSRFTPTEIIDLAALSDADIWAIAVPRETIRKALERNPFIESARVSLAGPLTIAVNISERRPICAVEYNNHRLVFDRTGELIEVLGPREIYLGRIAKDVPLGLLRENGTPFHSLSPVWTIAPDLGSGRDYQDMVASLALQFDRLTTL